MNYMITFYVVFFVIDVIYKLFYSYIDYFCFVIIILSDINTIVSI